MRGNYFKNSLFISLIFLLIGCNISTNPDSDESAEADDLIMVTHQQFESNNMKVGEVSLKSFVNLISCNGNIAAPPNGMANINSLISGVVEKVYCSVGDYVKKGEVLCRISSIELIELQQDFAETSANYKKLKADWERSKALYEEKIGAEKDYIAIENKYQISKAKYQSLKLRLELLDLNTSKIEAGEIFPSFPIMAPLSGYVTYQHIVLGQYIEQQKNLMEIVDINQLQLQLSVFETDINKLKIGQDIQFKTLNESGFIHDATLSSIGKTIHPETKTINCIANINKESNYNFINKSYIEARIILSQTETEALPSNALLKSGQQYFVLVLDKSDDAFYYLRKVKVDIGSISNGYTEIIGGEGLSKVLVQGIYNLNVE